MKKSLLALSVALAATALPTASYAQLAFNASAVSDYRYRGISQTRLKPALQGGIDYAAGAFYIGTWASTIKWVKDFDAKSNVEIDLYGGYKGEISPGLGFDVGVLTYIYPSNKFDPSANTTEIYGALSFGPVTAKYSHSVTDTFANPDSKNSWYLDVTASFDLGGGLMLAPHVGHQKFTGPVGSAATYTDYSVTLSKDYSGFVPSIAIVGTDADRDFYVPGPAANSTKFLGKTAIVVGLKYNF